jgi:hypothetical protein
VITNPTQMLRNGINMDNIVAYYVCLKIIKIMVLDAKNYFNNKMKVVKSSQN